VRWRKYVYLLIGLCWVASSIIQAVMKEQGITDPLAWGWILSEFAAAIAIILGALSMILDHKHLLDWLRLHLRWNYPSSIGFCMLGFLFLCGGLLLLVTNVMDVLAVLGVIPNPYLP
jgi:hypothetical protein